MRLPIEILTYELKSVEDYIVIHEGELRSQYETIKQLEKAQQERIEKRAMLEAAIKKLES